MSEMVHPPQAPRRGQVWLAWLAILGVIVGVTLARVLAEAPADVPGASVMLEMQGRYIVAAAEISPDPAQLAAQLEQSQSGGSVGERLRMVVLMGELAGPDAAAQRLATLEKEMAAHDVEATGDQARIQALLHRIYDPDAEVPEGLADSDREFLVTQLGWFGRLALAPAESDESDRDAALAPAWRTLIAMFTFLGLGLIAFCVGVMGLILLFVLLVTGKVRLDIGPPTSHHGVYAETFAIWMAGWFAVLLAIEFVPGAELSLAVMLVAQFASLVALGWPVLRGVPWAQVRRDIGLNRGKGVFVELLAGVGAFFMMLPLLLCGVIMLLLLVLIEQAIAPTPEPFAPNLPAHPIFNFVSGDSWTPKLLVLGLAAVGAPVVEEIMFRGVLLRHLRDATSLLGGALGYRLRLVASVLVSGTIGAFVFAVVHPQGFTAVPALMAIAYGVTIAREWRGSLISCMLVHALWNGSILTVVMVAVS